MAHDCGLFAGEGSDRSTLPSQAPDAVRSPSPKGAEMAGRSPFEPRRTCSHDALSMCRWIQQHIRSPVAVRSG
eukprot:13314120-Alexandrium_andersonii.AAC.1